MKPATHRRAKRCLKLIGIIVVAITLVPIALLAIVGALKGDHR